jgi:DNA repair protein RecN (Recombination protein N)
MLTELRIKQFAIIDALTLPLAPGFNALTGETGAGKSIIVGALGLLLGERGSADLIRSGADKASVEGTFDIAGRGELLASFDERGIEVEGDTVVLRREITAAGRSRAWINGTTVTSAVLADLGRQLVNLHGQHESQSLLSPDSQREMLDGFAGATSQATAVRDAYDALASVRTERATLERRKGDAERRADYLRHVVHEIDEARPKPGEDEALADEARRLAHAEELRRDVEAMQEAIDGGADSALKQVAHMQRLLASIARLDPSVERWQELLDGAYYNLEELGRVLSDYESRLDVEPERLREIDARRDVVFRLSRKYGGSIDAVLETLGTAKAELDLLDTAAMDLSTLETRERELEECLTTACAELTRRRRGAADRLAKAIDRVLPELGMPDGRFAVALTPVDPPLASGAEHVAFHVTLNVGHAARPLDRVASGGELSRVMLALKAILARLDRIPTLVFDEIDAGIGGRVALQVGDTMRRLADHHQVFAITHLAQIAARAHHHIVVSKGARSGVTTADVQVTHADARVREIARMLGGDPESDASRAHALELLETAQATPARAAPRRKARGA